MQRTDALAVERLNSGGGPSEASWKPRLALRASASSSHLSFDANSAVREAAFAAACAASAQFSALSECRGWWGQ